MLVRTSLRPVSYIRRVNGRACPSQLLLRKYVEKEDFVSLTQSFCDGSCKPLFPRLRTENCCVDIQDLAQYAIKTNSQVLRILLVHNVAELDLKALLLKAVEFGNRGAFCMIADLLESDLLDGIWHTLGLCGNMHLLKGISYRLPALRGLLEGDHFDYAKAYAKYNGIEDSGLQVKVFEKTRAGGEVHAMDALRLLHLLDQERCCLLKSTIHTEHLHGVKYLAYKNSRLDIHDLLARRLSSAAIDALRDCLPQPAQE